MALSLDIAMVSKPTLRVYRLSDGGGLALEISPSGSKRWRYRYRFDGKPNTVSCGVFPGVSLDEARARRDELKSILASGMDPSEHVRNERASKRAEKARKIETTRFSIDSDGSLSFRLGSRRLVLTTAETVQLRQFLDVTKAIAPRR